MPSFTETKKDIEESFKKVNEIEPREYVIESYSTAAGEKCMILRGSDDFSTNHTVEMKFFGVGYISMPTTVYYVTFSLAKPEDANPIQHRLSDTPVWVVCIEESAEGGPPFKYFVAAERIETSTKQVDY